MIKTKFLSGDVNWKDYGCKFITEKLNNSDWDYYLVIDFVNMEYAIGRDSKDVPKYMVSICAVKPKHNKKMIDKVLSCCGCEDQKDISEEQLVDMIFDYGIYATLYNKTGNNYKKLLKEAKGQLQVISGLLGFYMDRQQNAIGNTGWDFIEGHIGFEYIPTGVEQK